MNTNYKVYKHTNKENGMVYIGITKMDLKTRWNNGNLYNKNKKFYDDIVKFGWNNFKHEVLYENLNYKDAIIKENTLIKKYDSVEKGYNNSYSAYGSTYSFVDFFDFDPIENEICKYSNNVNYFAKVPNIFIQTNLKKTYGLSRIFLYVYITIDRNRNLEDKSYICIGELLRECGYKTIQKRKPKIFSDIIKCLLFMIESNFIEAYIDIYDTSYEKCIPIKIIRENFDYENNFTKIYGKQIDTIFKSKTKVSKESLLMTFLYINSYIGCRSSESKNQQDKPNAFWRSIESMAKELSMSKDTIMQCIDYLTTDNEIDDKIYKALLVKKEVGSVHKDKSKPPKNVPSIYVLNQEGYEQEIELALNKMLEIYGVSEFGELKGVE